MIVRTAVLEGHVAPGREKVFDAAMAGDVLTAIRRYPGLSMSVSVVPSNQEVGAPPVCMIFDLHFRNLEDMKASARQPDASRGFVPSSRRR